MQQQPAPSNYSPYNSSNPLADMQRFKQALKAVTGVKKADVEKSIAEEAEQKKSKDKDSDCA